VAGVLEPLQAREPAAGDAMSAVAAEARGPATVGPGRSRPAPDGTSAAAGELVMAALDEEQRPPRAVAAARPPATPAEAAGRMVLLAGSESMVRVRSRDGGYVRTRKLAPGERLALPERDDLIVSTDNGGGVELVVDGRSRGLLGQRDEIVRDLPLQTAEQPSGGSPAGLPPG
jgi:hypothetical protein